MTVAAPAPPLDEALLQRLRHAGPAAIEQLAEATGSPLRQAAARLAQAFGMHCLETADMQQRQPAFDRLPLARAQFRHAVLLHGLAGDGAPFIAVLRDPFDAELPVQLEMAAGQPVALALATPQDIDAYLRQQEAVASAVDVPASTVAEAGDSDPQVLELTLAALSDEPSPAVRVLNSLLYNALRAGASDVHLDSVPQGMVVKYRIDGVLEANPASHGRALAEQLISRLKVLAQLDIGERRIPQDGSLRIRVRERMIDLRVSIMPGVNGEGAVIRILDKQAMVEAHGQLTLDALGFDPASLRALRELMDAPYGMLLVTGPTGSGKTTTLYAALSESHTGKDKIITIEDPVEYQLADVLQIPVNEKKGLTFERGLRSILRHDPDRIMVGEIRDRETAEIAVQSALTGHLVLSTVHANNVFDVFGRFTHMGIDPFALASALNGIWAQRLIRLNCVHCSRPEAPSAETLERARLAAHDAEGFAFMRGHGCGDCRGTGYRGRSAIAEILLLDDEMRELIAAKEPVRRLKDAARQRGTRSLRLAALDLVRQGRTTLDEVRRVTQAA